MMLTISARISLASAGRVDQSYHVSKGELKIFGDSTNDRTAGILGKSESFGITFSGSNPSSVTSCVTLGKSFYPTGASVPSSIKMNIIIVLTS